MDPLGNLVLGQENLVAVLRDLLAKLKSNDLAMEQMAAQLEAKDADIQSLRLQVGKNKQSIVNNEQAIARNTQAINALKQAVGALETRLLNASGGKDHTEALKALQASVQRVEGGVTRNETVSQRNEGEIDRLRRDMLAAASDQEGLDALRAELRAVREEVKQLGGRMAVLDRSKGEREAVVTNAEEIAALLKRLAALQNKVAALEGQQAQGGADGVDGAEFARFKYYCEGKFNALADGDRAITERVDDLAQRLAALRAQLDSSLAGLEHSMWPRSEGEQALRELEERLQSLVRALHEQLKESGVGGEAGEDGEGTGRFGDATREWVSGLFDDLLKRLAALEKHVDKNTRQELKRFERDIMLFLDDLRGQGSGLDGGVLGVGMDEAAAGRIHFRCLSCDQKVRSQHGAATDMFHQAIALGDHSVAPKHLIREHNVPTMLVERGGEVPLFGRDGQVYKGRDNTTVVFTQPSAQEREAKPAHFTVAYADKHPGNRAARPASAAGAGRSGRPSRSSRPQTALGPRKSSTSAWGPARTLGSTSSSSSSNQAPSNLQLSGLPTPGAPGSSYEPPTRRASGRGAGASGLAATRKGRPQSATFRGRQAM